MRRPVQKLYLLEASRLRNDVPDIPPRGEDVADCFNSEGSGFRKLEDVLIDKTRVSLWFVLWRLEKKRYKERRAPGQIFAGILKNVT